MKTDPIMRDSLPLIRIPSLKTTGAFRARLQELGLDLPLDEEILSGEASPVGQPLQEVQVAGKTLGNRIALHPMEGWDGTHEGGVTDEMRRRWHRFGESGAKLICGGEAMAVRPDGRANPNQLILRESNLQDIRELVGILKKAHAEAHGTTEDLVIAFQLTHSGRFCRPHDKSRWESRVAFRHPILDRKFQVTREEQVLQDEEVRELIRCYIQAARLAREAGADMVDIKHCHGYLLHEFLGAHTRPGPYGGSFENRTRILREIIDGIRADGNPIGIAVRLSTFDKVPYRPDPEKSVPGKLGPGMPEDYSGCLPYRFGFGVNPENPDEIDLTETFQFVKLCADLGVEVLNTSAGSPYYTPHLQRPAAYPPSDGYQPAYDPLIDVERQIRVVRDLKAYEPRLVYVGSGYSYLQEYLPQVAQAILREGWADLIGMGRAVLSYPRMLADAVEHGKLTPKVICRTFSDCTTAPRNGLISGCYPLDKHYTVKSENQTLKAIKKQVGA